MPNLFLEHLLTASLGSNLAGKHQFDPHLFNDLSMCLLGSLAASELSSPIPTHLEGLDLGLYVEQLDQFVGEILATLFVHNLLHEGAVSSK